jgi:hypothetical protein
LEHERNLELTVAAFRDYQAGVMPAGPGARALIGTFAHVDAVLRDETPGLPVVLDNDRRVENLLRGQARPLHLGLANYCWFSDPSKALCLKLADTPGREPAAGGHVRLGPLPAGHPLPLPPAGLGRGRPHHHRLPRRSGPRAAR